MRTGDLEKQIAYDEESKEGIHYSFESNGKEVRLSDIFAALREYIEQMPSIDKQMLKDMCIMISNGKNMDLSKPIGRVSLLRYIIGFLMGRYFANTSTHVKSERILVTGGDQNEST